MRVFETAEIVAVGSELLTPHRTDTNSLYLTGKLNELGIDVRRKTVVGDRVGDLEMQVVNALAQVDVVLITGGLGPTEDDVTRQAVASALHLKLREDPGIVESIAKRFARRGIAMPESNRRQAQVPEGAVVLSNPLGTAPGLWIDVDDRAVVLLPGPPREMQPMFETLVAPKLAVRSRGRQLRRRVIRITGRAESLVDEIAQPIYTRFRDHPIPVETSILAAGGQIELHLSAIGVEQESIDRVLESAVDELSSVLQPYVISIDGRTLEEIVGELLVAHQAKIAVAESCTGGLVLTRLTSVPGSSKWVEGGVTAYANAVKIDALGVPAQLIEDHGAVSEAVAAAMASGIRARFKVEVGVAVTGIAGPDGGTPTKPVGTVCLAISGPIVLAKTVFFHGDRHTVRAQAAQAALDLVRRAFLRL